MIDNRSPRRPSRILTAVAVAAAALFGSLVTASPAAAHDSIVGSSPEAGATMERLPDEVTLTFSGVLLDGAESRVVVVDESCPAYADLVAGGDLASFEGDPSSSIAGCADHAAGSPVIEGAKLTQALDTDDAPAGGYAVIAGVVYGDTHPGTWVLRFSTTEGTAPATPTATPENEQVPDAAATAAPDADEPDVTRGDDTGALPWIIGGVLVVAAAGILVIVLASRRRGSS